MRRTWRSKWWLPTVLAAAAALGGCGGDDDDDGGSAVDAGVNNGGLDEVGAALTQALCPQILECCSSVEVDELFDDEKSPPTDVPGCVAVLTAPMEALIADLAESVEAGRLRYDGARMEACLERIGELPCGQFGETIATEAPFSACDAPFAALVAVGGDCAADIECTSQFCAGFGEAELGSCAELPGEGDPCVDSRCGAGLYCDEIGLTCIAQKADGADCGADDECQGGSCPTGQCAVAEPTCDGQE
jgi:hypothetical protein